MAVASVAASKQQYFAFLEEIFYRFREMAKLNGMKLKRATKQIETAEAHRQRHKTNEIEIERVKTRQIFISMRTQMKEY